MCACEPTATHEYKPDNVIVSYIVVMNLFLFVAGTAEDKMRMFIIYYLMTADMSEVCGWG